MELEFAAERSEVLIIPILLPGADPSALPDLFQRRQQLDMRDGVFEAGMTQLAGPWSLGVATRRLRRQGGPTGA
jgi:hypothetical protein